jgi:beta-lactamase regulating signal transducer with metallopeptidase domain
MDADLLRALTNATFASSAAVLLVCLLRKPLRATAGARAAYWLWLLVPVVVLASLLPAPSQILSASSFSLAGQVRSALSVITVSAAMPQGSAVLIAGGLATWAAGACVMFVLLLRRQRSFIQSLGTLLPDKNGFQRSEAAVAPMLVGAWKPRIVVPFDFEARYAPEERDLMLAHERAHLLRHDIAVNAIAAGWLCLFWFNPLIYWAIGWIRMDQELACDALVLAQRQDFRRCYANTLLKTQLATESVWRMPVGCPWHSNHSLKERILMLKRPLPGLARHVLGIAGIVVLTASSGYAAWAGQGTSENKGPLILVDIKMTTTNPRTNEVSAMATRYLVHSGELPADMQDAPIACTPFLPPELTPDTKARRLRKGQILLECLIREGGKVVGTPSGVPLDGRTMVLRISADGALYTYELELNATTSEERIAEAEKAADKR